MSQFDESTERLAQDVGERINKFLSHGDGHCAHERIISYKSGVKLGRNSAKASLEIALRAVVMAKSYFEGLSALKDGACDTALSEAISAIKERGDWCLEEEK